MISHCANPECKAELTYLEDGELFAIQLPDHVPQYYWLCPACAANLFVMHEPAEGVRVVPRPTPRANPPWGLIQSADNL